MQRKLRAIAGYQGEIRKTKQQKSRERLTIDMKIDIYLASLV